MTIAELFVKIGVKGGDQAKKAFSEVDKGIRGVQSSSLAAKAAIVGVIYALQRMSSSSAKMGTTLNNFSASTGLSAKKLQEWQYAGQQVGISNEAIQSSVQGVQDSIVKMRLGLGSPMGLSQLIDLTGFDTTKADDTFYVLEKLQELSQKVKPAVGKTLIDSFGAGAMFTGFRQNAFRDDVFKRAPILSDKEISNLAKVDAGWKNFFQKFNMSVARLNAKFGPKLIVDLQMVADKFLMLTDAVIRLAKEMKLFDKLGTVIENITNLMNLVQGLYKDKGILGGIADVLNALVGKSSGSAWWMPESWNTALGYGDGAKAQGGRQAPSP